MQVPITALYAAVLAIFALVLSARAGMYRGKAGASILYGEPPNMELAQRVRVHQNFLEYVPMLLILIGILEMRGVSATTIHVMGVLLVVFRIAHAVGLKADDMSTGGRFIGAAGTALLTLVCAVWSIVTFFQ